MRKDRLLLFGWLELVIHALSMCLGQDNTQPCLTAPCLSYRVCGALPGFVARSAP